MTIKESLARLSASLARPMDEYVASDVAVAMVTRTDFIAKLEPFHLPEITKLICGSEELLAIYGEQYSRVAPFYVNGSVEWIYSILPEQDKDSGFFSEFVFPYASLDILKNFLAAYRRYVNIRDKQKEVLADREKRKATLEQKMAERTAEKEKWEAAIQDAPTDIDENQLAEMKKRVSSCKSTLTKTKRELANCLLCIEEVTRKNDTCNEIIIRFIGAYNEATGLIQTIGDRLSEARQAAFDACDDRNIITSYISAINDNGEIPVALSESLKQYAFSQQFLSVLDERYGADAVSIIARLYESGAVDIYDDPFSFYLSSHPEAVSRFFVNAYVSSVNEHNAEDSDFGSWLGFIIDNAFPGDEPCNQLCLYDEVWESITTIGGWQAVVDALLERKENLFHSCVAKILLRTSGMARKQLLILVQKLIEDETIDSMSSLAGELLENHVPGDDAPAIIDYLFEKMENESSKLRRVNERMAFKMNRLSTDVFSAVSDAVEGLETLASNLDSGGEAIAPELVASRLKKNIVALRKGLEVTGVSALEDSADWMSRREICFDADKHTISVDTPPQKVYLRTLGFIYTDSEGNTKTVPAKVGRLQELSRKKAIQKPGKPGSKPNKKKTYHSPHKHQNRKGGAKE